MMRARGINVNTHVLVPRLKAPEVCNGSNQLGECAPCLKSSDCVGSYYCCPYMKKCVSSSVMPCYYPIAECSPMCYDNMDNAHCNCKNPDFPNNWCEKFNYVTIKSDKYIKQSFRPLCSFYP